MLPILRSRNEGSVSQAVEPIVRKSDEGKEMESFDFLDAIVDDLHRAIPGSNKALLKTALESLIEHLRSLDTEQDSEMEAGEPAPGVE